MSRKIISLVLAVIVAVVATGLNSYFNLGFPNLLVGISAGLIVGGVALVASSVGRVSAKNSSYDERGGGLRLN